MMLMNKNVSQQYVFRVQNSARQQLIKLGFQPEYGARPLKRVLKRHITDPLASMVGSGQIDHGDLVLIGVERNGLPFTYSKYSDEDISMLTDPQWDDFKRVCA
jgi:ATP-dependent Clp protease ATP-binding subunit ClpB